MLLILNPKNALHRVIRRGIVIGVITFLTILLKEALLPNIPEIWSPLIIALLAALDKASREK